MSYAVTRRIRIIHFEALPEVRVTGARVVVARVLSSVIRVSRAGQIATSLSVTE